jgi:tetratricopeptide (TPR) repeat protein
MLDERRAGTSMRQVMVMRPDAPGDRQHAQAEALQWASRAIADGRAADAERIARDVLAANAGNPESAKILGYALLMQDRVEEAIAPLERVARSGKNPEIETQLAIAWRKAGDTGKALIWLKRAIKRTPPFASAFHELGCVLHSQEQSEEAIAVFKQGIAVAPMSVDLWLRLGATYFAIKDRANARAAFEQALAVNPGNREAVDGLVTLLMHDGDYARAAELLRGIITANPDDTVSRIALGNCMLELSQPDTAYACLRSAAARETRMDRVLGAMVASGHSRFWLRPSDAVKFFKGERT